MLNKITDARKNVNSDYEIQESHMRDPDNNEEKTRKLYNRKYII